MEDTWQQAWQWLCRRRQKSPPGADIWHLRFHRERELFRLIRGQESLVQWCARDELQDIISHFREGLKSRLGVVVCQESGCVPGGRI